MKTRGVHFLLLSLLSLFAVSCKDSASELINPDGTYGGTYKLSGIEVISGEERLSAEEKVQLGSLQGRKLDCGISAVTLASEGERLIVTHDLLTLRFREVHREAEREDGGIEGEICYDFENSDGGKVIFRCGEVSATFAGQPLSGTKKFEYDKGLKGDRPCDAKYEEDVAEKKFGAGVKVEGTLEFSGKKLKVKAILEVRLGRR